MRNVLQEFRLGLRQMRKAPVFTVVAMLTLALGIGANTAVFTLLDQALLRSLPVSHPEQLVRLRWTGDAPGHFNSYGGDDLNYFSYPMYRDLRDLNQVFQAVIANGQQNVAVSWNNNPDMAGCELVSGNYFEALGVRPALGRLMVPSDEVPQLESRRRAELQLLENSLRVRSLGNQPNPAHQHPTLHHRRSCSIRLPQHRRGVRRRLFVPLTAKGIITPRWQDLEDRRSRGSH